MGPVSLSHTLITDVGLSTIAFGCRNLTHINLSDCQLITDAGFAAIGRLESLAHLGLCHTSITDVGLTAIASGCRNLTYINLRVCVRITDAGVAAIMCNCHNLTRIELYNCNLVTYTSFRPDIPPYSSWWLT